MGYHLDSEGLKPSSSKIQAILTAPRPENVTTLKSYLDLINLHHTFMPMSSDLLNLLYKLTKEKVACVWLDNCEKSFQESKRFLHKMHN